VQPLTAIPNATATPYPTHTPYPHPSPALTATAPHTSTVQPPPEDQLAPSSPPPPTLWESVKGFLQHLLEEFLVEIIVAIILGIFAALRKRLLKRFRKAVTGLTRTVLGLKARMGLGSPSLSINHATQEELENLLRGLPGISPTLVAQRIIEYREKEGRFKDPEEIMRVKGVGKKTFERIKYKIRTA
jgi:competence ComEA-like helix-hairpin-helix protein